MLALLAAAVFATAASLQHRANHATVPRGVERGSGVRRTLRSLPQLLRHPVWLAGLLGNWCGFFLHSAALHLGDLAEIQAVLVTQLLFALPLAALRTRRPPLGRDWAGTAAVCGGIALLLLVRGSRTPPTPSTIEIVEIAGVGIGLMAALIGFARLCAGRPRLRTVLLGVVAGIGFSITAALILVVGDRIARFGVVGGLLDWPTAALLGWGVVSSVLVQAAFASGELPAALTAMTAADPLSSWLWSLLFLDATPTGAWSLAGYAGAGTLIATGVWVLAYSPTRAAVDARPVPLPR
jgi:hypothetical protein